jgi:hypothetical protein
LPRQPIILIIDPKPAHISPASPTHHKAVTLLQADGELLCVNFFSGSGFPRPEILIHNLKKREMAEFHAGHAGTVRARAADSSASASSSERN